MIKKIKLENVKTFKSTEISNLERVNIFGGKNNVGKSSILELVCMFLARNNPSSLVSVLNQRISYQKPTMESIVNSLFYELDRTIVPEIKVMWSDENEDSIKFKYFYNHQDLSLIKNQIVDSTNYYNINDIEQGGISISFRKNQKQIGNIGFYINDNKVKNIFDERSENLFKYIDKKPTTLIFSNDLLNKNTLLDFFLLIDKSLRKDELLEMLRIIDDRIIDISLGISNFEYRIEIAIEGIPQKVPIEFLGQGTIRFLSTIMPIMVNNGGVVCIDEIENGIHHTIFEEYWHIIDKLVKKYNVQLFITTHNEEILKYAMKIDGIEQNLKYYRLSKKSEADSISVVEYTYDKLAMALERGWGIR